MKNLLTSLFLTIFCVTSLFCNEYEIECKVSVNNSGVDFVIIHFNVTDGGCGSNDFTSFHHMSNGEIKESTSTPGSAPWGVLDFRDHGCCDYL